MLPNYVAITTVVSLALAFDMVVLVAGTSGYVVVRGLKIKPFDLSEGDLLPPSVTTRRSLEAITGS